MEKKKSRLKISGRTGHWPQTGQLFLCVGYRQRSRFLKVRFPVLSFLTTERIYAKETILSITKRHGIWRATMSSGHLRTGEGMFSPQ